MGKSLAVVLANIWMNYDEKLSDESQTPSVRIKDTEDKCPDCHKKMAWNSKAVECEKCKNWYDTKCQNIDKEQYKKLWILFVYIYIYI